MNGHVREESFGIGAGGSGHDSEEEAEDVGADADGFLGGVDEVFGAGKEIAAVRKKGEGGRKGDEFDIE